MARILMALDHAFPPDIRVENEALSLSAAGHDVTVLAIGPDDRPGEERLGNVRILRDRIPASRRNRMRGLAGSVPLLTYYLSRRIRELHRDHAFDAVHAHDLYMCGGAIHAARRLGVKVVADLHENWVAAIEQYAWSTRIPARWIVRPGRWRKIESKWLSRVDGVIVVIEEMEERLRSLGVPADRIAVVSNTVRRPGFDAFGLDPSVAESMKSDLTLLYTGGMDRHRGLETALRAMPAVLQSVPGARLILVGDGAVRGELEALSDSLGLTANVIFMGRQPQERIPSYIAGADIGLIPHVRSDHTDHTIPHKLFHYMYMGVPVVSTDCRPLRRILLETGAGRVAASGDADAFASAVLELAGSPDLRRLCADNGQAAVAEKYNWERSAEGLVRLYDRLFR
jgi:glycosyltransferase involved in cell wall biosynthesis